VKIKGQNENTPKLPPAFYKQKTEDVARKLLGKKLVRVYRGRRISGIITETEAYLGTEDRACHSFGGRKTEKIKSMYLMGGHAYVYFIYGMYFCFNVVTRTADHPEAVLIRSLEPVEGIEFMEKLRKSKDLRNLTTGPGKLCQALKIDKNLDGESLLGNKVFIEDGDEISPRHIVAKPRIGIHYAKEARRWPLRFYIKENHFISKK